MVPQKTRFALLSLVAILAVSFAFIPAAEPRVNAAAPSPDTRQYIVVAKSDADYSPLRSEVMQAGATIVRDLRAINSFVAVGPSSLKDVINSNARAEGAAEDGIEKLIRPEMKEEFWGSTGLRERHNVDLSGSPANSTVTPDPAFSLPGLMWNVLRIRAPQAWQRTLGDPAVKIGVADTGLDYTHVELQPQVVDVVDFTTTEDPPICKTYYGKSDQDWSALYGGPVNGDWNGHGSWIGGNIAAALDGQGINGIAPNVKLVSLKISQWCGFAWDSTIIDAFLYAADHGIDVVSISFGGYLDLKDREQALIYGRYLKAVAYALSKGTVIVASAGNDHVRVGPGGVVLSHGRLTTPGSQVTDLYGLYELSGGIPGVINVAATNNIVNSPSTTCPPDSTGSNAWCKPTGDAHQPFGVGERNQLAYYSNYGPRIDFAAPGGARKFNLPVWDRGGTPGWPVTTADQFNAWEDFSITSNWALGIPCYTITGGGFPQGQCYSTIQGTSMATPHVSAVLGLIASKYPALRHNPPALIGLLTLGAKKINGNLTPPLSATDTSAGDLTGALCTYGYCHLGGDPIRDAEVFGAGLVDAYGALTLRP